jgi:hypothetical protein
VDLFEPQWVVFRWPVGLLSQTERDLLEEYLDSNFQIGTIRFEAAAEGSGVDIIGAAQGVVREAVLEFVRKFIENPPNRRPYTPDLKDVDEEWYGD